eukprot:CAMPEP_0175071768 /NCGR_PEP_ID=MMETSP0052_2-20121109/19447_1 /TAXON_ID=51329 ORGANISM="Polytomella parva, Strain SAG 63-3" /NCGR_SAMPLE_ID=MMETSP0052_2 /ASSEMBLY_ACC=CAM_ASM_000194 /LENGTH=97 /DNA_ID=CAMNT_0016339017 /DNA_START=181 /DNA_END=470 /DNA_ORIENTATION=+
MTAAATAAAPVPVASPPSPPPPPSSFPNDTASGLPQLPDWVIARCAPVLYLHPKEKYFPVSVEWYLSHATVDYTGPALSPVGLLKLPESALAAPSAA